MSVVHDTLFISLMIYIFFLVYIHFKFSLKILNYRWERDMKSSTILYLSMTIYKFECIGMIKIKSSDNTVY